LLLRIVLFEVSEQISVREVLKAGSVVSHHVSLSWEEVAHVTVAVEALVVAGIAAEPGSGTITGDGAFGEARQGRGVVGAGGNGGVGDREGCRDDRGLSQLAGLLQVAVRDVASGVVSRHQALLHFARKGMTPEVTLSR
jgi:hypothetical protein